MAIDFLKESVNKKIILHSKFMIKSLKEGINFKEKLEGMGFKLSVIREDLQEVNDLKHHSLIDKKILDSISGIYRDRDIDKKPMGRMQLKDFLIKEGNEGFFIASTDQEILRNVPKKIMLSHEGIIIVDNERKIEVGFDSI